MVKQEEVIHSSKVRRLCTPPRKVGGLSPPASAAYGVDCELFLVCSKLVETNFKNDEHSAPYRWVTIPRALETLKKPLGINLHMVPSPEIQPRLHCLELTSLHLSVNN